MRLKAFGFLLFLFYGKLLPSNICLQKQRNSKLVNLKSQAQAPLWREWDFLTVPFVRISNCFFRMIFSGKDVCLGLPTTPHEALRSTCLIDREKRGKCVWNFTKFSTQNMLAIKSRNRFGEEFVITKTLVKERIVRKKLL